MIPAGVLEHGERAFIDVLRRRYPEALFDVRDLTERKRSVRPVDPDVMDEVTTGAARDLDPIEEAGEHVAPLGNVEAAPEFDQATAGRNRDDA